MGSLGIPPRHITIAPALVGVPQANSGKTLRKSTCKGFWLWLAERKLHPLGVMLRQQSWAFDRAGLQGLVQDLYAASKDNQAFLHSRLGLGHDQLGPEPKKPFPDGYAQTQCGTSRYRFPNLRRQLQTTRRRLGPGRNGGAIHILLRGGIQLSRVMRHGR